MRKNIYSDKELNNIKSLITEKQFNKAKTRIEEYKNIYPYDNEIQFYEALLQKEYILSQHKKDSRKLAVVYNMFKNIYNNQGPMCFRALYEMGKIRQKEGRYQEAIQCFGKILEEAPYEDFQSILELAKCYEKTHQIERAKSILTNTMKLKKDNYIILALAKLELKTKNIDVAENLIKILPENKEPSKEMREKWNMEGLIAKEKKDYDQAIKYFKMAATKQRDYIYWYNQMEIVRIYKLTNDLDNMIDLCQKIVRETSYFHNETLYMLGEIYEKRYDKDLAKKYFEEIVNNNYTNYKYRAKLKLGEIEMENHNFKNAKKYFTDIIKNEKGDVPSAYCCLISIALREEDYDRCYELLEKIKILKDKKEIPEIYRLGRLEMYINKKKKNKLSSMPQGYLTKQIFNYKQEDAVDHIRRHHVEVEPEQISKKINLEQMVEEVRIKIDTLKPSIKCLADEYVVKYNKVGYVKGEETNYVKVVCIPETDSIITMYPVEEFAAFTVCEEKNKEEKRMSQIDKFNARYEKTKVLQFSSRKR